MQPLQPLFIAGSSVGLETDKKPFMLPDQAFQFLENAYVFRDRVKKREGLEVVGRLRRILTTASMGNISIPAAGSTATNIYTRLIASSVISANETNAQIETGNITNITIVFGAPISQTLTDTTGTGVLTVTGAGVITGATLNYATGILTLTTSGSAGVSTLTITGAYYPMLPAMGILKVDDQTLTNQFSIFFNTVYCFVFDVGSGKFKEFIPGTTWSGNDTDFFLGANFRGITADIRLTFVTNFNNGNNIPATFDPIRYTNGATWTNFAPTLSDNGTPISLFQARIIIPYYGRLLALNTWEGTTAGGGATASNFYNRCRFSQIGNPIETDAGHPAPEVYLAWRSDIQGRGGFIDAPTNEKIVSASFFKNTLIVKFDSSTWQLRYVGEYGLPFLWERISSDYGSESTFSSVLFDEGVLSVDTRGVTSSQGVNVQRIDVQIPDQVYEFQVEQFGLDRIQGVRDFQKELVYWCYADGQIGNPYPNRTLVYNYRNNTYAIFRNNITCFGTLEIQTGVTWDSLSVSWDSMDVTWTDVDTEPYFPYIVSGNQQGFIHYYGYSTEDDPSLAITSINIAVSPNALVIPNHNLEDGEIIYLNSIIWQTPPTTDLNGNIFRANITPGDNNNLTISYWDENSQLYFNTPAQSATVYVGGGTATLFPQLYVQTKDFNPYQSSGKQMKISYIDFLTDATFDSAMTVQLYMNSSPAVISNLLVGNKSVETSLGPNGEIIAATQSNPCKITSLNHGLQTGNTIAINNVIGMIQLNTLTYTITVVDANNFTLNAVDSTAFTAYQSGGDWVGQSVPYYVPASQYAWHRFFATAYGQYISIAMTYSDDLMNDLGTHQSDWVLNAIAIYHRPGGKLIF